MSQFSASETDRSLNLVSACQEFLSAFYSYFKIVNVDLSRKADFLDVHNLLIAACFLLLLGLLEAELAVIHNAADGGLSGGGDLDQIEAALVGFCLSGGDVNDTQLCAVAVDKSDFFV